MQTNLAEMVDLRQDHAVEMRAEDSLIFLRNLPDSSMKLIVTSPPYNLGKKYETKRSLDSYVAEQASIIAECVRVLHPQGSICWQVGNHVGKANETAEIFPLDIVLYPLFKQHGLKLRNRIIWHFEHGLHCSKRLSGRHEAILWFTKSDDYTFHLDPIRVPQKYPGKKYFKGPKAGKFSCHPLGKNPGDVWIIPNVKFNHVEKTIHPCQFPVELVERLVLALTDKQDAVLDPYMGVGSSIVAAIKHQRRAYGCDLMERYVEIAWDRVKALRLGQLPMRPMNRPVYNPALHRGGHA